jgi:hypothetical protein
VELMIRFYAAPAWEVGKPSSDTLEPVGLDADLIVDAFARAEYRGERPLARAEKVLQTEKGPPIFAQPPNDLPALLRLADQLITLSRQDAGERAKVWRCDCGTRYAVPVALLRPVSIKCERCGRTLELEITTSVGDDQLVEPFQGRVNLCRKALSDFFREAMARGWPVLVSKQ